MKKTISLILVIAMTLSMFAMFVSAEEVDVEPASVNSVCPECFYSGFLASYQDLCEKYITTTCKAHPYNHLHAQMREYEIYICSSCGYTEKYPIGNIYFACTL